MYELTIRLQLDHLVDYENMRACQQTTAANVERYSNARESNSVPS